MYLVNISTLYINQKIFFYLWTWFTNMRFNFDMMEQHSIWLRKSPEHLNIHVDLICNMHLMRCNISWTVYSINNVGEVFHDMFFLRYWLFVTVDFICYFCIFYRKFTQNVHFMEFTFKCIIFFCPWLIKTIYMLIFFLNFVIIP